jgi:two-component system, sensor histidine kinase and response regulator
MLKRIDRDIAARDAHRETPAGSESPCEGLPKKVLVAEDNIVSQQVAKRFLEAIGCEVILVENGAEAVHACAHQDFGLVLMDLQMPVMDGMQAAQEIRRHERPGRHVPILALTAKSASDELARCSAAGMNGLLTKPLEIARLRTALDRFGLARRMGDSPVRDPGRGSSPQDPVDLMTLRAQFSGDLAFVRSLCESFVASTSHSLDELEAAVAAGEPTRVRLLAHKIKGGSTGVHAHRMAALAAGIESEALSTTMAALQVAVESLRRAFDEASLHIGAELS